jgi:hypothetical protein
VTELLPCPPEQWAICDCCCGEGSIPYGITVYEVGCGYSHPDTLDKRCDNCSGWGGWVDEVNHD